MLVLSEIMIKRLRDDYKTQEDAALDLGLSQATISKLVTGARPLSGNHIERLAKLFSDVPLRDLWESVEEHDVR